MQDSKYISLVGQLLDANAGSRRLWVWDDLKDCSRSECGMWNVAVSGFKQQLNAQALFMAA